MKVDKRRRKENKTDYLKRMKLLKSGRARIVFRKTNKYIIAQLVQSSEAQDSVEFGITSKELMKHGWPEKAEGGLKSTTASYLTGFLFGKEILKLKNKNPIVDLGMYKMIHKSKIYAFLKGLIDAGLKIECEKECFPEEKRIEGVHMKHKVPFKEIKSKLEKI
jgi:large subunit ribosomal protein L18